MTMSRANALTYLQVSYTPFADEASLDADTLLRAYGAATDAALRMLGTVESLLPSALVDDTLVQPFLALLDFFALSAWARVFAVRVDIQVDRLNVKSSQAYGHIMHLKDEAERRCTDLGYSPTKSVNVGRFELDFNEPGLGPEFNQGMVW